MSRHTYHRADGNQRQIVQALRKAGARVVSLSMVGSGVPDLLVEWRNRMMLVEVKQPGGKLREGQKEFMARWDNVAVIYSIEDALRLIGVEI